MSDPLDLLTRDAALSPDERAALARAAAADPALAGALAHWDALGPAVRRALAAALPAPDGSGPDRDLLVLAALAGLPRPAADDAPALPAAPDLLDAADRARFDAARPALDAALARHPGLDAALRRLRADRDAFESAWEAHTAAPAGSIPVATTPRRAADRPAHRTPPRSVAWRVGRYASVLAVVAMVALAVFLFRRDAGWERVVAEGPVTLDLPDGSTVELAAGAELMLPAYAAPADHDRAAADLDAPRTARLVAGRALFQVAHTGAPFTVETPAAVVTVLGTTFGVETTARETDVVLVTGVVEVAPKGEGAAPVRLAPGQASQVTAGQAATPAAPADLDAALAWTGDLFFRAEPLGAVAARLGAAFRVPVEVDPTLATQAVSGRFARADGVAPTLRALALAVDGRVEQTAAGGFRIVPGGG